MGILTASALVAGTGVVIPLAAAPEALDGYVQVTANLQRLRDVLDLPIPVVAVVPTRFDQRLRIARDVLAAGVHFHIVRVPKVTLRTVAAGRPSCARRVTPS